MLRALERSGESLATLAAELEPARGADRRFDDAVERLSAELGDRDGLPFRAGRIAGRPARCLQGSLLLRYARADVADAFCASRLGGEADGALGTLPAGTAVAGIVGRAVVGVS